MRASRPQPRRALNTCSPSGAAVAASPITGEVPNSAAVRLVPFILLFIPFWFPVLFLTLVFIGSTPGGIPLGSPRFPAEFAFVAIVVTPSVTALSAAMVLTRAPRQIRVETFGFSFHCLAWVGYRPRLVRIEVPGGGVIDVRPWGLALFYAPIQAKLIHPTYGRAALRREGVYLDRHVVDRLGLTPRKWQFVYLD
jgi:hypothetical protein